MEYQLTATVVVRSKDAAGKVLFKETFKAEEVRLYKEFGKWFFDHFGKIETEFFGA